jgi:transposase
VKPTCQASAGVGQVGHEGAVTTFSTLIKGCLADEVPEIAALGRTLQRCQAEILNHHRTGASNGPTEAMTILSQVWRVLDVTGSSSWPCR